MFFLLYKQRAIKMKLLKTKMTKRIIQKWDKQQLKRIPKSKSAYFIKICLKRKITNKQTETKSLAKSLKCITKESLFFQLNLKLGSFVGWVACFQGSYSLFVFRSPLSRHDCRSQVLLKALGSCPYLWNDCSLIRGYFLGSTGLVCWSLLARRRRILRQYFWILINSYRSHCWKNRCAQRKIKRIYFIRKW